MIHYSYFIPTSSPIIPTYSCNFIVSVIIMSTIHTVAIILVNRILPVLTFFRIHINIATFMDIFTIIIILKIKDYYITFTHCNFQCVILVNLRTTYIKLKSRLSVCLSVCPQNEVMLITQSFWHGSTWGLVCATAVVSGIRMVVVLNH